MAVTYKKSVILFGILPGNAQTVELPEGTISTAVITITYVDINSAAKSISPASRSGMYATFSIPSDVDYTQGDISLNVTQERDFQDTNGLLAAGTVTALAAGAAPTLTLDTTTTPGTTLMNFGIPAGAKGDKGATGDKGDKGEAGKDGASVTVTTVANGAIVYDGKGNSVTITNGAAGKDGINGTDGKSITVASVANGAQVTDGAGNSVIVTNGKDGKDGKDGNSFYTELAGGQLWAIRPRLNIASVTTIGGISYTKVSVDRDFVIEESLYEDPGVFIPDGTGMNPSKPFHVVKPSMKTVFGTTGSYGRVNNGDPVDGALNHSDYEGWYWAELSASPSSIPDLSKIEVQINPAHCQGYTQYEKDGAVYAEKTGHARGVLMPYYMGASVVNGKIRLWFRFLTYCFRAKSSGWTDNTNFGMWDGIGNDYDAWDLNLAEVHWWSTNVAQGFQFNARIRK